MLFVDPTFIFLFVPITVLGFWACRAYLGMTYSLLWLTTCSIFFYGYQTPRLVVYLLLSYVFNYAVSRQLASRPNRWLFAGAVAVNLAYLAYFKYANFLLANFDQLTGAHLSIARIALPLGISFYTFQQIVYLSDSLNGHIKSLTFAKYISINSFFPHLIAGPIIWHREIAPQLERSRADGFDFNLGALGLLFFAIGFFKKVMIADNMALISDAVFKHADAAPLGFGEAWMGALAYSIQIYFDFSGYSEMAIGLALLFGIRFPINFFSPYKATSIIEFWRRWHMTMTRFFQEFVYMPMQLAATRRIRSPVTNYLIIVVMMFLVGLWHGAGWTWIAWGVLHGLFLCVNHLWRAARSAAGLAGARSLLVGRLLAWTLTYACVVVAWVLFRADDFATASKFYHAMFFMNGFSLPHDAIGLLGAPVYHFLAMLGVQFVSAGAAAHPLYTEHQALAVFLLTLFVATAPNLLQAVRYHAPGRTPRSFSNSRDSLFDADLAFNRRMWAPTLGWATVSGLAFVSSLLMILDDSTRSVFIYFNF